VDQDMLPDPMITLSITTKQIVILVNDESTAKMATQQSWAINLFLNVVTE
jgi:hypothetical protein